MIAEITCSSLRDKVMVNADTLLLLLLFFLNCFFSL